MNLAKAADDTAGSMLSLVAVDQDRMVSFVQDDTHGLGDLIERNFNKRLLVGSNSNLNVLDTVLLHELNVRLRVLLGDQGQNGFQLEHFEIRKVGLSGERASIDTRPDHGEILRDIVLFQDAFGA